MARLVLHIGTAKTGTSFIQHRLFDNAGGLAEQGWIVPTFGDADSHLDLALALLDDPNNIAVPSAPKLSTLYSRQQRKGQLADQLTEMVKPDSTWVISSEYFQAALLRPDQAVACEQFFRNWFAQIDVVLYARRQDYVIPSLYTEALKTMVADRDVGPLDWDFITAHWIDLFHLGTVRRWGLAFGPEHVIARPYLESWGESPGELFADFASVTGMPEVGSDAIEVVPSAENLSAEGVRFIRRIYPELNARVLGSRRVPRDALGHDEIGRALMPFVDTEGAGNMRFRSADFIRAVAAATRGDSLRLTAVQVSQILTRYALVNDDLVAMQPDQTNWQRWHSQPPPDTGDGQYTVSDQRTREILRELQGPRRFLGGIRRAQSFLRRSPK